MPDSLEPDEQLEWEERLARPAGLAAIAAAVLLFAGTIIYPTLTSDASSNSAADALRRIHDTPAHAYIPGLLQTLGYLAMALPLYYLYQATKARREELLSATRILLFVGSVVTAIVFMAHQVIVVQAANDFASERLPVAVPGTGPGDGRGVGAVAGVLTVGEQRAADLLSDKSGTPVLIALQYAGILSLAFALVLLGLNAMRAGLLSRFLGYLAITIGVLTVVPLIGPVSGVIQIFWLGAIGLIFLNRWPGGRGPAWSVAEPLPWPTAADKRAALQADAGVPDEDEYEEELDPEPAAAAPGVPAHPSSKKRRKRKRR